MIGVVIDVLLTLTSGRKVGGWVWLVESVVLKEPDKAQQGGTASARILEAFQVPYQEVARTASKRCVGPPVQHFRYSASVGSSNLEINAIINNCSV